MKLSIVLVTYNHEKYIRQCVESILMQQFGFAWELIIACDKSTDKTLAIAEEYRQKAANVTVTAQEKNVGATRNCAAGIAHARGELIAIIDGDDYNVDPLKYKKQVAIFESRADISFCFADGYRYFDDTGKTEPFYKDTSHIPQTFNLEYFYRHNVAANPTSFMFRKACFPQPPPDFYFKYYQGDWMLISFCGLKGDMYFFNEKLACYRVHSSSILRSTNKLRALRLAKELNDDMNKYLNYKYGHLLGNNSWYHEHLTYEYLKEKQYKNAALSFVSYLTGKPAPKPSKIYYALATIYNILKGKMK